MVHDQSRKELTLGPDLRPKGRTSEGRLECGYQVLLVEMVVRKKGGPTIKRLAWTRCGKRN